MKIRFDQRKGYARREPVAHSSSRVTSEAAQATARWRLGPKSLVHQPQMQVELEQFVTPSIQVGCASLDCLVRHALPAGGRRDHRHLLLTEGLVDAAGLVQAAERRFVPMNVTRTER